jgi:hypothetical protein
MYGRLNILFRNGLINSIDLKYFITYQLSDSGFWVSTPLINLNKLYIATNTKLSGNSYITSAVSHTKELNAIEEYKEVSTIVLGWTYIKRTNNKVHYVVAIETFIKGEGIGTELLFNYANQYNLKNNGVILIPIHIIETSVNFWASYFKKVYDISNKFQLSILLQEYKITEKLIYNNLYKFWDKN